MRGRLLGEIGELRGLHSRELESIKAFITRTHESWVPKYREFQVTFPRRIVFIGTTNRDEFLADETGNRRWLPVTVGTVNVDNIRRDRNQLWAEAALLYAKVGVDFSGAQRLAEGVHDDHKIVDSWEDAVARWLDEPDVLTGESPRARNFLRIADVLKGAMGLDAKHCTRREELRVAAVLRKLGFMRKKVRDGERVVWAYVPDVLIVPDACPF
jgi:predicted P-loop ATPase